MPLSSPKPLRQQRFVLVVLKKCHFYGLRPLSLCAPIPLVCIHVNDGTGGKQTQWMDLPISKLVILMTFASGLKNHLERTDPLVLITIILFLWSYSVNKWGVILIWLLRHYWWGRTGYRNAFTLSSVMNWHLFGSWMHGVWDTCSFIFVLHLPFKCFGLWQSKKV